MGRNLAMGRCNVPSKDTAYSHFPGDKTAAETTFGKIRGSQADERRGKEYYLEEAFNCFATVQVKKYVCVDD
eukprot:8390368-Heterocapsa_arctica.AAC.1